MERLILVLPREPRRERSCLKPRSSQSLTAASVNEFNPFTAASCNSIFTPLRVC
jgi:hypothetical protein